MNKIKILIIEDEVGIVNIVKTYLQRENYEVLYAHNGSDGLDIFNSNDIDLVILDLMLPKMSGEDILKKIRSTSNIPVILLTAKVSEEDKIFGLRLGADDYITKPFSPKELVERVKVLFRRIEKFHIPRADIIKTTDGRIEMDLKYNIFKKDNEEIFLTKNEAQIVKTLFSNPNKIFTREEIIELNFGYDYNAYDRAIDTHIKNIRQKIEDNPKHPKYIKTIYGMGYKSGSIDDTKK